MRQVLTSSFFILLAVYAALAIAQGSDPEPGSTDASAPPGWPETLIFPEEPAGLRDSAGGSPSPSFTNTNAIANASANDKIVIAIANTYNVKLDMGFLGGGTRNGYDTVEGTLTLQQDGKYRGTVKGFASGTQELKGLGQSCPRADSAGWQELEVVGTPIDGFGPTHQTPTGAAAAHPLTRRLSALPSYNWISGQPDGGYLSLEFFPTTAGVYSKTDPCQTEMQQTEDPNRPWFLPFNDAQWTTAHAGYGIAVPASGTLQYYDNTSGTTIVGTSTWYVIVERLHEQP